MRAMAAPLAGLMLACGLAAPASAETSVLPERPGPPGVVFVDNAAIVDGHPMAAESFSRVDDRTIAVHFTTGTPACYGVYATAQETSDTVTVELFSGTLPEAVGRACIMIGVFGSIDVPLSDPLGDRQLVSVY